MSASRLVNNDNDNDNDSIWTITTALRRELELGEDHVAISESVSQIVSILLGCHGEVGVSVSMEDYEPGALEQLRDAQLANKHSAEDILKGIELIKSALID